MGQSFDLRKKSQLNRIANNITEPAILLNKVINAIKVGFFFTHMVLIVLRTSQ
jgi:hypothetical protein